VWAGVRLGPGSGWGRGQAGAGVRLGPGDLFLGIPRLLGRPVARLSRTGNISTEDFAEPLERFRRPKRFIELIHRI